MKYKKVAASILLVFLSGIAYASCTTQTIVVNGKITVCTVCGTVVNCF